MLREKELEDLVRRKEKRLRYNWFLMTALPRIADAREVKFAKVSWM